MWGAPEKRGDSHIPIAGKEKHIMDVRSLSCPFYSLQTPGAL